MLTNNFSTFETAKNLKLLTDLNLLQYLKRHEKLNFALFRVKLHKAIILTLSEFEIVYTAYDSEGGAV